MSSLCHIVGFTPEAPDLKTALGYKEAEEIINISKKEIQENYSQYR